MIPIEIKIKEDGETKEIIEGDAVEQDVSVNMGDDDDKPPLEKEKSEAGEQAARESGGDRKKELEPRNIYIKKADVVKYGPSPECRSCQAAMREEKTNFPHTKECRSRMMEKMKGTEEGEERKKRYEQRREDTLTRMLEEEERQMLRRSREEGEDDEGETSGPVSYTHLRAHET